MASDDDSSQNSSGRYYVKRASGKVFGPFDKNAIQMMLKADKIGPEASVSTDKQEWTSVASVPAFAGLVDGGSSSGDTQLGGFATGERAQSEGESAPSPPDLPTPKGETGDDASKPPDLPTPKGETGGEEPSLPAPKESSNQSDDGGGIALPGLTDDEDGDDPSLPKSAESSTGRPSKPDLPTPKDSEQGNGSPDLPTSKEDSDRDDAIPLGDAGDSKRSADDDSPSGNERLPRSAERDPSEADDGRLPRSAEDNLPKSGGERLPQSARQGRSSSGDQDLPRSADDNLPESKAEEDDLPASADSPGEETGDEVDTLFAEDGADEASDDLFAEDDDGADDVFGGDQGEEDDLFGGDADDEDDIFAEEASEEPADEDLFGDEESEAAEDDIFAEPDDDELFAESEEDDLFAEPEEQKPELFGEPDDGSGDQADVFGAEGNDHLELGETGGESDPLQPEDDIELGGGEPSIAEEDEELDIDAAAAEQAGIHTDSTAGTTSESSTTAAPESAQPSSADRGAPEQSASTGAAEAAAQQARGGSSGRLMTLLGILLLVGGGAVAYTYLAPSSKEDNSSDKKQPKRRKNVTIDLRSLEQGTYPAFQRQIANARGGSLSGTQKGKFLLVQALFLSRYDSTKVEQEASELANELEDAEKGFRALGRGAWAARNGRFEVAQAYLDPLLRSDNPDQRYYAHIATGIGAVRSLETSSRGGPTDEQRSQALPSTADTEPETPEALKKTGSPPKDETSEAAANASDDASTGSPGGDTSTADTGGQPDVHSDGPPSTISTGRDALEAAAKQASELAEPHYWLGRLAEADDDSTAALDSYRTGLKRQSNHVATRLRIAHLHYQNGSLEAANDQAAAVLNQHGDAAGPPDTAEAHHLQGMIRAARSDNQKAVESFVKALEKQTDRPETIQRLAEAYAAAGKHKEALNYFKSNDALSAENPEVALGIVRSHVGLQQWQAAMSVLEESQKRFPDDARFPYRLGKLHLKRGALGSAQEAMQRAVKQDPTLLEAHGTLAKLAWKVDKNRNRAEYHIDQILRRPKRIDAKVATKMAGYYRLSDRPDLAEKWYKEALERNPNYWPGRLALVELHLEEQRPQKALSLLENARDSGVEDVDLWANLAEAYRQTGKYDRALQAVNKALDEESQNPDYLFTRGLIHFDRGNYRTAIRDFNETQNQDPMYHRAQFFVGRIALARDNTEKAMQIIRQVLDDHPDNGEYRFWMARVLERRGRKGDALAQYRKVSKYDEDYGREHPELFIRRGILLVELGYSDRGAREIRRALEYDPESAQARLALGNAHFEMKNYDKAIEQFQRALKQKPKVAWAQQKLGMALVYEGRKREGAGHLQKAVETGYENPEIYRTLGYLYKELGKRQLAVESFKSFLRESPDEDLPTETRREMLRQIEELGG